MGGRLEALSTFMQPYGSIRIRSRKMQSLELHLVKSIALQEHKGHGGNSFCGCKLPSVRKRSASLMFSRARSSSVSARMPLGSGLVMYLAMYARKTASSTR